MKITQSKFKSYATLVAAKIQKHRTVSKYFTHFWMQRLPQGKPHIIDRNPLSVQADISSYHNTSTQSKNAWCPTYNIRTQGNRTQESKQDTLNLIASINTLKYTINALNCIEIYYQYNEVHYKYTHALKNIQILWHLFKYIYLPLKIHYHI